ncbi:MAG: hypothetical protein ACRBBN_19825 [Methyloligellaceae bacterium]
MPRLNAPTILIFLLSLLLAGFAIFNRISPGTVAEIGMSFRPYQDFWLAITAYIVLMVGTLVRGL